MMIPIHNFDIAYNLIKHMFQERKDINEASYIGEGQGFLEEYDKLLLRFEEHLERFDDFYCIDSNDPKSFKEEFSNCPYRVLVNELKGSGESVRRIGEYVISQIVMSAYNRENRRLAPDTIESM